MNLPMVSIVVAIKNEARYINKCLDALLSQNYPTERYEVLVIDGGSTDGTLQIIEDFLKTCQNMRLMKSPGCSYPQGLNIGLRAAQGDIWTFVDGHAVVQANFLSKIVKYLSETGAACVGGVIQTVGEGYLGKAIAHALSTPFGIGNAKFRTSSKAGFVDTVPYGAYRRKIIEAVGYFDETRLRSADLDLHYRIRRSGGKFFLAPEISTYYHSRPTLLSMIRQAYANGYPLALTLHAASPRHFVPALFVILLLESLLLMSFSPYAGFVFWGIVLTYIVLDTVFGAVTAAERGWVYLPILLLTYPLLHLSYGAGSLVGFVHRFSGLLRTIRSDCRHEE